MKAENNIAFKEWAVVVDALGQGKQILILRKGGIREEAGEFRIEHNEFFLFPTYEHQNKVDLKAGVHQNLDIAARSKPDFSSFPIGFYVQVAGVICITDESDLKQLEPYHVWSSEAVQKRFHFGHQKGLFAIAAKVSRLPSPHLISVTTEYSGCKSWVELEQSLSTRGAKPVLSDPEFQMKWEALSSIFSGLSRNS